jgi:endonuclease YncB( thermonuclease family)
MKTTLLISFFLIQISCNSFQESNVATIEDNQPEIKSSHNDNIFNAKVIRIIDGDTLEVMYGELPVMIRLAHIDCPEKRGSQPFGKQAKQTLSDLCFDKEIKIHFSGDKDRNGRYVCEIFNLDGLNLNKEMVIRGMAWHYKKYSSDSTYAELENQARKNKIGLWKDPNPIPPWEWRK